MVKKQSKRNATIELRGDELPELPVETGRDQHQNEVELAAAVRGLSPKHRMVIELCYFEGYSLEEISQIVNSPVNTVKTRLHHARKKLRDVLDTAREQLQVQATTPASTRSTP